MSFNFTCPFCNQAMQCEDAWAGMAAQCPTCGKNITLTPESTAVPPPPVPTSTVAPPSPPPPPAAAMEGPAPRKNGTSRFVSGLVTLVVVICVVAGGVVYGMWEHKREIVKTAEKVVEEIIEREVGEVNVTHVEVKNLTKTSGKNYKARATITATNKNNRSTEKGSCEIKIEDRGTQIWVEIVPHTWVDLSK